MDEKKHEKDRQSGLAAVEMALVLPVLVLVFLAILEVGRVLDAWVVATNAAREGARYAAYGESAGVVTGKVNAYLNRGLAGRNDVTPGGVTVSGAQGTPGNPVIVVVPVDVKIFAPWLASLGMPDPVRVQASATMRLQ